MIIDLSIFRKTLNDNYSKLVFYSRMSNSPRLNSYTVPLIMYYVLHQGIMGDKGTNNVTPDALLFGGCEVLRQINNYFMLYKK